MSRRKMKAQTLTELAIFGSILLFCAAMLVQYGLEANYQQQVQMEVFRKAQTIAFNRSGLGSSTSLVLIKDKPLPDPRDQWGFAERNPIAAGANVTWDTNLSAQYVDKYTDTPEAEDLPALYFDIDKVPGAKLSEVKSLAMAGVPSGARQDTVFGFYAARFEKRACPGSITVIFDDPRRLSGREYVEVVVDRSQIKVMRIEGGFGKEMEFDNNSELLMYPFFRYQGLRRKITLADVDADGKLEYIIAANKDLELLYIDYHDITPTSGTTVAGAIQMDTEYVNALPYPYGNISQPFQRQGLLTDFQKTVQHTGSRITKDERGGSITSRTQLNARQVITHKIRLNNGQVLEIPAEFESPRGQIYNWR